MGILGIDEAGKGPVLGPLVMCAVILDDPAILEQLNVKDSKLLTPKQREDVYEELKDLVRHELVIIEPTEIDRAVAKHDLNWLEAQHSAILINKLWPHTAYIDCPSRNIRAYTSYIYERLDNKKTILHCRHKADRDYPVVSAASILAKVTRDRLIEHLKADIGIDFGSGYLSDPKTQTFMERHWHVHPHIFRHSWAPYKSLKRSLGQRRLGEF